MLFPITFFLAIVFVSDCKPIAREYSVDRTDWHARHPECFEPVGNNNDETAKLRNDCEIIFSSEYVKWSEEMLANEDFASSLEVIDVTNHSDSSHTTRHKRGTDSTCPRYNKNYLDKVKLPQQRSLSPWTFVVTTDQNRIPRVLVDSKCLCDGCIDTATMEEDAENFVSYPLTIEVPIRRGTTLEVTEVSIGCTCMLASITRSN